MKALLLDTNVLIKFFRSDDRIAKVISSFEKIFIPTIVIGEYKAGVDPITADGKRQIDAIESFLDSSAVEVLPITEEVASAYARVFKALKERGTPIPQNDLWIAACAVESGAAVFSLDRHFANVPLLECV